jgi:hypothetical protein
MFSEAEITALRLIHDKGGVLISHVSDKNEIDVFGNVIPGIRVFAKLIKKGLVFITEEEPFTLDNGEVFCFTPTYELTEVGIKALNTMHTHS